MVRLQIKHPRPTEFIVSRLPVSESRKADVFLWMQPSLGSFFVWSESAYSPGNLDRTCSWRILKDCLWRRLRRDFSGCPWLHVGMFYLKRVQGLAARKQSHGLRCDILLQNDPRCRLITQRRARQYNTFWSPPSWAMSTPWVVSHLRHLGDFNKRLNRRGLAAMTSRSSSPTANDGLGCLFPMDWYHGEAAASPFCSHSVLSDPPSIGSKFVDTKTQLLRIPSSLWCTQFQPSRKCLSHIDC